MTDEQFQQRLEIMAAEATAKYKVHWPSVKFCLRTGLRLMFYRIFKKDASAVYKEIDEYNSRQRLA